MKNKILLALLFLILLRQIDSILWIDDRFKFDCSMVYHQEGDINLGVAISCPTVQGEIP